MSVAQALAEERPRLLRIAYRMLGSFVDAEDVVNDVAVESLSNDLEPDNPAGWLTTITVRRSLDLLRRRKRERQSYPGSWLPEPELVDQESSPDQVIDREAELSIGFLRLSETLTPPQRAVIILRSLGYQHDEIAVMLEISTVSSRQYEYRGRHRLGSGAEPQSKNEHGPRNDHGDQDHSMVSVRELLSGFLAAARDGDTEKLIKLLHADVVYYSDGGGRVKAARKPVVGAAKVARFADRITRHSPQPSPHPILVNGRPGVLIELGGRQHVITADKLQGFSV